METIQSMRTLINKSANVTNLDISKKTYNYNKSEPANKLRKYNIVNNKNTDYTVLKFNNDTETIAECRFCIIDDKIGYIHSIEVNESFRNNNIGTNILQYSINKLSNFTDKIYIYPTNRIIKHICRDSLNFKPANKPDDWYYKIV